MTILPKKKASKDKNDPENTEHSGGHSHPLPHGHSLGHAHGHSLTHPHVHGHYHHQATTDTRLEIGGRGRTSPTRWSPPTSRDEKLHPSTPAFDFDFESHDSSSSNHKRRHRSSPHRIVRKHRSAHSGHTSSSQASPAPSGSFDLEEDEYNSEDEHAAPRPMAAENNEFTFERTLKEEKGFIIKKMGQDGACLFRAVADQVYGDQDMHGMVRKLCIDYMAKNAEFFSQYVTEDFRTYLNRKRMDDCHGNHLEIQAIAELFNRPVEVYMNYSLEPSSFHSNYKTDNEPIRLSYHQNVHYDSVVDPYKATIGVGLGLPGLQPGQADKSLMESALKKSEDHHLEKAMLEDKMRETDWELTQDHIEEQVARESYLQWLREQEHASKQRAPNKSASATCSSACDYSIGSPEARTSRSPRARSGQNSPQHPSAMVDIAIPGSSKSPRCSPKQPSMDTSPAAAACSLEPQAVAGFSETASMMDHLPVAMYGGSFGLDEDDIMAQVMAISQQEYIDSLKQKAHPSPSPSSSSSSSSSSRPAATVTTTDLRREAASCSTSADPPYTFCDS